MAALDTFSAEAILYKKIDTLNSSSGQRDSIFIYSLHQDSARYNLSFIEVGQGNGDYTPDLSGANGKVYKWIAPVNAVKQGRYAPATFLATPKNQQVMSLGLDYALSKSTVINTEFGYSKFNVNTFSQKDKSNDQGYAAKIMVKHTRRVGITPKNLQLTTEAGFEYVDARFRPLERLRNVEFARDWGLPYLLLPEHESIIHAGAQLSDEKRIP